jgi:hypothetical protein
VCVWIFHFDVLAMDWHSLLIFTLRFLFDSLVSIMLIGTELSNRLLYLGGCTFKNSMDAYKTHWTHIMPLDAYINHWTHILPLDAYVLIGRIYVTAKVRARPKCDWSCTNKLKTTQTSPVHSSWRLNR